MAELRNRLKLEASAANRLRKLSKSHQRELTSLLGSPPNLKNVPDSFWNKVQEEQERALAIILFIIFIASANQHGLARGKAETQAKVYADSRASEVAKGYVKTTKERFKVAARDWKKSKETPPQSEVNERVESILGGERQNGVVVTEVTAATSAGSEFAVNSIHGLDEYDLWFTMDDSGVCPVCEPLHQTVRSTWTKTYSGGPPGHPNCRCWIDYWHEREGGELNQHSQAVIRGRERVGPKRKRNRG